MITKNYLHLLFFTVILGGFQSCKKPNEVLPQETLKTQNFEGARAKFKSFGEYLKTKNQLDSSSQAQENWRKSAQHESLEKALLNPNFKSDSILSDLSKFHFPPSNLLLLNKNGEVQFGDTIAWFSHGKVYYIPSLDPDTIKRYKENPFLCKSFGVAGRTEIETEEKNNSNARIASVDFSSGHPKIWRSHQFIYGPTTFRFITDIWSYREYQPSPFGYSHAVYLETKLQYFSGRFFHNATESWNLNCDVNINSSGKEPGSTYAFISNVRITVNHTRAGIRTERVSFPVNTGPFDKFDWRVSVTGRWNQTLGNYTWIGGPYLY